MLDENQKSSTLLELLSGIVAALPNGLVTFSETGEVNLINSFALKLLGLEDSNPNKYLDTHYYTLFQDSSDLIDKIELFLISRKHRKLNLYDITIRGQRLNIQCFSLLKGVLVLMNEITDEVALLYRENNDMLTQLNNRQCFEKQFLDFIHSSTSEEHSSAIIFFDIDNFKTVNDSFGHSLGDDIICHIANILKSRIEPGQLIARIGGDQFVVLLNNCTVHEAESFAEYSRRAIDNQVFSLGEVPVRITISSGIAPFCTNTAPELTKLLSIANTACKTAKSHGKNRTHVIDGSNDEFETHIKSVRWIEELNRALSNNDLILFAQKISSTTDQYAPPYYEVLLRLRNSQGEIIAPYSFIPTAERYHMMPEIDRYVMTTLFSTMGSQGKFIYSVNLSGQTVSDYSLLSFVEKMLDRYIFDPRNVIFEITETAAMNDFHSTIDVMHSLRELGFQFSLDDFGTGLSSFTYLKELPLDTVKIDGSFVRDITKDKISYQMVKSIHDIAQAMGLKTVAEFVENKEVYQCIADIGVQFAQGYYVHKPEPIEKILKD